VIVARYIGQNSFGALGVLNTTLSMFVGFAGLSMGVTATKHVAEFRNSDPARAGKIIGLSHVVSLITGAVIASLVFIFAPAIASKALNAPALSNLLRLACVILLTNAFNGSISGALVGLEAFKKIAKLNLVLSLVNFIFVFIGVNLLGLTGVIFAMIASAFLSLSANYLILRKLAAQNNIKIQYTGLKSELPILWNFSIPALLSTSIATPVMWLSLTFLVNKPGGYGEMGIFNAAFQWRTFILFIPNIINQASLPIFSNLYGNKNYAAHSKLVTYNLLVICLFSFLVWGIISIFSKQIMSIYGPGFANGSMTMILLTAATVFHVSSGVIGQYMFSTSKIWHIFTVNSIWAVILIISSYYLTSKGSVGLALAYLISYGALTACVAYYTFILKRNEFFAKGARPV